MDLISIVVPVYNQEESLKQALDSIISQTYQNTEVIIVDDGSDNPLNKERLKLDKDKNIKLIQQENQGAPAARNRGLQESSGNFIIFWDADVIAESNMLEKMYNKLSKNTEASYAYCNMRYGSKKMPAQEFNPKKLKQNNFIHSTSLIRSEDVIKWDESLQRLQDWDLWLSMFEEGKTGVWINEYLFKTIPNSGGISDWLPSFSYKIPFKWIPGIRGKVKSYEKAKKIVQQKHNLS